MGNIRSIYESPVNFIGRWWSRLISIIFGKRKLTPLQMSPYDTDSDASLSTLEERTGAIYVTNVSCMYGMHWIRHMLNPYGRIVRIARFRFTPIEWSYLVVFATEVEAKAAFNGMRNPPDIAKHFYFNLVNHERLRIYNVILSVPDDNVDLVEYSDST